MIIQGPSEYVMKNKTKLVESLNTVVRGPLEVSVFIQNVKSAALFQSRGETRRHGWLSHILFDSILVQNPRVCE